MEESIQTAYDAVRNFDQKTFRSACYAPFVSLYFTSLGNVLACCKNDTFILGNVAEARLKEIWNGRKMMQLRKALSSYHFEAGCDFCEWQITEGNYRPAFPTLFEEFEVGSKDPQWPAQIEFAGSNTCNFECVMCYGELSSSIRAHRDGLPPLPRFYSDQFFEDLSEFLPHLKRAKFLGGEPFLASETHRIWQMMMEKGLSIPCHITTNGSQYNEKVIQVLERLPISLTVSIDGVTKETYEKIRVNSEHDEVFRNLHRFREYTRRKGTFFSIAFCLIRQNWHEFIDMLLFTEELDCPLFVNTVISPSHCSLYTLPAKEVSRIADEIEEQGYKVESRLKLNRHVWKENIAKLRGKSDEGQAGNIRKIRKTYSNLEDHIMIAWNLANKGCLKEALNEIRKVTKGHPSYYASVADAGELERRSGNFETAERDLYRAIQISSKRAEAFVYLAALRHDQNRIDEALEHALHAQQLIQEEDLMEADLCEILASIYSRLENFFEAIRALDRLVTLRPKNAQVHLQRALVFQVAGMQGRALQEAEATLALDPDNQDARNVLQELEAAEFPQQKE